MKLIQEEKQLAVGGSLKNALDQHIDRVSRGTTDIDDTWPQPWPAVGRTRRLVARAKSVREEWWATLSSAPSPHSADDAILMHDVSLLPVDLFYDEEMDSRLYPGFADYFSPGPVIKRAIPETNNPFQNLPGHSLLVAVEYIDGFAIVFHRDSNGDGCWRPLPIRGRACFDYNHENVSLRAELLDYLDISNSELTQNVLVLVSQHGGLPPLHYDWLDSLPIHQTDFFSYDINYTSSRTLHIDLTANMLRVGIPLKGKVHWRLFPEWSLKHWIEHSLGEYSDEIGGAAQRAMLDRKSHSFYSTDGKVCEITAADLRIPELIRLLSRIVPDRVTHVYLSGWLDTPLVTDAIAGIRRNHGTCANWVSDTGPPLSLWKYSLICGHS